MDSEDVKYISETRMEAWKEELIKVNATPVVLFGIEHGMRKGYIHMVVCENMSDKMTKAFLLEAIKKME